jgi:hypothetical protein
MAEQNIEPEDAAIEEAMAKLYAAAGELIAAIDKRDPQLQDKLVGGQWESGLDANPYYTATTPSNAAAHALIEKHSGWRKRLVQFRGR